MKDTGLNKVVNLPFEQWVIIKNYLNGIDGKYAASNFGRIKRIVREITTYRGGKWVISEKLMPQRNDSRGTKGYMRVCLSIGHTCRVYLVHRIIAHCFHYIKDRKGIHVNHKDFNTLNNHSDNLEWTTREENNNHYQNMLADRMNNGEVVSNYRFSKKQIIEIFTSKLKFREISEKYNVNWKTIGDIKNGYSFKSITKNLPTNTKRRERLTQDKILDIYKNRHLPVKVMTEKYDISDGPVIAIRTGRRYSHITNHKRTKPFKWA